MHLGRLLAAATALGSGLAILATPVASGRTVASCPTDGTWSDRVSVTVWYDGCLDYLVRMRASIRGEARHGHFEFYGPDGHLTNSATRVWSAADLAKMGDYHLPSKDGDRWCARFWEHRDGGVHSYGNPACVTDA